MHLAVGVSVHKAIDRRVNAKENALTNNCFDIVGHGSRIKEFPGPEGKGQGLVVLSEVIVDFGRDEGREFAVLEGRLLVQDFTIPISPM